MGYELWKSPNTGIRRRGTSFNEIQSIFVDNITTKLIYEPLYSCPIESHSIAMKHELTKRDFDVAGVVDENKKIIGYCLAEDLKDETVASFRRDIDIAQVISDSTPIAKLLTNFI